MQIEIRYYGSIRETVGRRSETLITNPGTTLGDLLGNLVDQHPELARELSGPESVVMHDGTHVDPDDGGDRVLADGSVVAISSRAMPE